MIKRAFTIYQSLGKWIPRRSGSKYSASVSTTPDPNIEKLNVLASRSTRLLMRIHAVFPFNFFPDELILDENSITHRENRFFYTTQIRSISYEDIFNVTVEYGIVFGQLAVADKFFIQQPIVIHHLRQQDARRARRIINGMIIVKKEKVDATAIPLNLLIAKAEELGRAKDN